MRMQVAIWMLLFLVVVHINQYYAKTHSPAQEMIVAPILSFEIVVMSPRVMRPIGPPTTAPLRRSWNYNRKERHPT